MWQSRRASKRSACRCRVDRMKVLVTGADGFIGSHLVRHLEARGDSVDVWTRRNGAPDIRDLDEVRAAVERSAAEAIYHLAGQADVARSWDRPGETLCVNAGGTANLLASLRQLGSGARVLLMSSSEVYGNVDPSALPITEDAPLQPATPYGVSKVATELAGIQAWQSTGQPVVICRPFNHIGPDQSPNYVASAVARRIAANERSGSARLVVGDLSPTRDFVDVRDAVRAYRLVMVHGVSGEAYNVSSGHETEIRELVHLLVAQSTIEQQLEVDATLLRPARLARVSGSIDKLRSLCGWGPETELTTTAADMVDDWRRRLREENES